MPLQEIDTPADPFASFSVSLDGVEYLMRMQYNQRSESYYLSLGDPASGADLISSVKVVSNYPLLRWYKGGDIAGLPPGELVAFSNTPDDDPANVGELGLAARMVLTYLDSQYLTTGT